MPWDPGRPQRTAGAQGALARNGRGCCASIDVVLQCRAGREDNLARSARACHSARPHSRNRNVLHEQIRLVDDTRRLTSNLLAVIVRTRERPLRILGATPALTSHLTEYLEISDRRVGHFRMTAALCQRRRNPHVGGIDRQYMIVPDQLVHELVDVEPDLVVTTDDIQQHRIFRIRTQAEIHQRNRAAILERQVVAAA